MKIFRAEIALAALAVAIASVAVPVVGHALVQDQDAPESLLPEGFGDPVAPPPPAAAPRPARPAPGTVQPLPPSSTASPTPSPTPTPTPSGTPTPIDPEVLAQYELPDYARRSLDRVGAIGTDSDGIAADGFGRSDGRFLTTLMRRTGMPIASRWLSIVLRRALLSRVDTPSNVNGADFAAERAWLLLRMGESVAARDVVQSVDTENYTPKMYQVAMQVALATADPAAMCPLVDGAMRVSNERGWVMAQAMCAGLEGRPREAGRLIDQARRANRNREGIDVDLAEKVLGAGAGGRRAVTIEWDGIDQLDAWRYGLATATGVEIPASLIGTVRPQVRAWQAQAPQLLPHERLAPAEYAAARGVLSNLALVDLYGAVEQSDDSGAAEVSLARDLRAAYTDNTAAGRLEVLRGLWGDSGDPLERAARLILTARAAARIVPNEASLADADRLVAAMLTAGLDTAAARWAPLVPASGTAWALIALSDASRSQPYDASDVRGYSGGDDQWSERRRQLFFAGVAGLARIDEGSIEGLADSLDVPIGDQNAWTRAIAQAAQRGEAGTVILLAATGMQTPGWAGVAPATLFHITAALRAVGREGAARMIAAEALSGL
ncbi:hypothetical protein [Sphingomonas japonica]|uniref:Secreted protein n=1 Tax=Sphingomonas japonica TaxID=511662 RepID=A0ABX0U863_9SPHN|nr:hypothetical protein [Sphingomonas japonica]NIJ24992.1 hypothetical protein [Sphingomonas japonica]